MPLILKILKYQLPAILWAIFIYILCLSENNSHNFNFTLLGIGLDKIAHFILFMVFTFVVNFSWYKTNIYTKKFAVLCLIIAILYGIMIELLQHFYTVTRTADMYDVLADTIGAFIGYLLFLILVKSKFKV